MRGGVITVVCAAALPALAAAVVLERAAPEPRADVSRGSEDAFAEGLHPREFLGPIKLPHRWTTAHARFRFRHLPEAPVTVDVAVHGHHGPVVVAAAGVVLGVLDAGRTAGTYTLAGFRGGTLEVELRAETFVAGDGRTLGTFLDRVAVFHPRAAWPALGLILCLAVPAAVVGAAGVLAGLALPWAMLAAAGTTVLQTVAAWPNGAFRSGYMVGLAGVLVAAAGLALAFALWVGRRHAGAGGWAFAAVLAAVWVQGIAAASPLMVVSDAMLHANKLGEVARGNWFPTSETQHARPFRFPYGVSFYAPLVPLERAGVDRVALVRCGAAAAGVAASLCVFWLVVREGARRAALATLLLQVLPATFLVHSYGNLSNVFGQAATVFFFTWWTGRLGGGWVLGALLLVLACLSHLSSMIVLTVLGAAVVVVRRKEGLDRRRLWALAAGLGLAAGYYATFLPLIVEQLPRLLEGGGAGRTKLGPLDVAWLQVLETVKSWGVPALILAVFGWPRPSRGTFDRDLAAFWAAGGVLLIVAVVSPVEVRFLYALTLPAAVAAARGADALAARGGLGLAAAVALLIGQVALGLSGLVAGVLHRYRL